MRNSGALPKGTKVLALGGEPEGVTTGASRLCQLESCGHQQVFVRWPDGKHTWPCVDGMKELDDGRWQIQ